MNVDTLIQKPTFGGRARLQLKSLPNNGKELLTPDVKPLKWALSTPIQKYDRDMFEKVEAAMLSKAKSQRRTKQHKQTDIASPDPAMLKKYERTMFEKVENKRTPEEWVRYARTMARGISKTIVETFYDNLSVTTSFVLPQLENRKHMKVIGRDRPVQLADAKGRFKFHPGKDI